MNNSTPASIIPEAKKIAGKWSADLSEMAICKIMDGGDINQRLLTTGTISTRLLGDEDYLEVIRLRSFGSDDLEEVRVAAADAGAEGRIADRTQSGAGREPDRAVVAPPTTVCGTVRCRKKAFEAASSSRPAGRAYDKGLVHRRPRCASRSGIRELPPT